MNTAPLISIRGVTKRFGGVTALADVSLDVRAGELHAICGENGAGKSTLMKILSGVITDFEGTYQLRGQGVWFRGTRDAELAGVSIIHQELNLVEQLCRPPPMCFSAAKSATAGACSISGRWTTPPASCWPSWNAAFRPAIRPAACGSAISN